MIRRWTPRIAEDQDDVAPKGFDDFDLRLGDVLRGERATMGKSLLDVQRELRIKAAYIAAIENSDPSAFDTPGFIAGYVRSYARYLGMDPDDVFDKFCTESGFVPAHGMSAQASSIRKREDVAKPAATSPVRDPFADPNTPFAPGAESIFSRIEPGAVGSLLVLVLLIGAIGFGGWSVLREIQRVQLSPVDQTPVVLSDLDPLDSSAPGGASGETFKEATGPSPEAFDRLYRPQALDVPVLVARDAPISTLDPSAMGSFRDVQRSHALAQSEMDPAAGPLSQQDAIARALAEAQGEATAPAMPKVVADGAPRVALFAVRPAWVRVRAADGTVIFEKILDAGEDYVLPQTEMPPTLHAGMSGSVYFSVNGELYGPAGSGTQTTRNVALSTNAIRDRYTPADPEGDPQLRKVIAELDPAQRPGQ